MKKEMKKERMKTMKKQLTITTKAISFLLALVLLFSVNITNVSARSIRKTWYKSIVSGHARYVTCDGTSYYTGNYSHFKVIDVNRDGTKELLLSTTSSAYLGSGEDALLLTYYKGEIRGMKHFGGDTGETLYYQKRTKSFVHYENQSGRNHLEIFRMSKGRLVKVREKRGSFFSISAMYFKYVRRSTRLSYNQCY